MKIIVTDRNGNVAYESPEINSRMATIIANRLDPFLKSVPEDATHDELLNAWKVPEQIRYQFDRCAEGFVK